MIITKYAASTESTGYVLIVKLKLILCGARLRFFAVMKVPSQVFEQTCEHTHTSRCADCHWRCHCQVCTAVSLITQVSRARTSLTYCLIIWTSLEINLHVECLWASSSGPRGGKRRLVSCVCRRNVFATCRDMRESEGEELSEEPLVRYVSFICSSHGVVGL